MHYNGNSRNGTPIKKYPTRKISKIYTRSILGAPTIIQLVALSVMWAVGMLLIFTYTDVFRSAFSVSKAFYYLLIIGSTTILIASGIAFFRGRNRD